MTLPKQLIQWPVAMLLAAAFPADLVRAQDAANQADLTVGGKHFVYKKVVAVRAKSSEEPRIIVLATGRRVAADLLKKVKETGATEALGCDLDQPYLKVVFSEDGAAQQLEGSGGGTSFTQSGGGVEGKATIAGGRIHGTVKLVTTGDFAKDITLAFDVPIDAPAQAAGPAKLDPPVKPVVTGKFLGNGKPAPLKYVSVEEHEPFGGKEAITLIFTEKDHSAAKKPSFDASFGKFGSSLILNVDRVSGGIFGCEVGHSALNKGSFSSVGVIRMAEFDIAGGNVTGEVTTGGTLDAFGQKWEVELRFAAPLPEKLRKAPAAADNPAASVPRETVPREDAATDEPKAPAGPHPAARKLPLPKDAGNVRYLQVVEQIQCSSAQPVDALAGEISATLKTQGWKEGTGSLITERSAILKREQGDAKLTIMIQAAATGSTVKIFTEGLDWSGTDAAKPQAAKTPAADDDADAIEKAAEKEADKLLKDALKNLPGAE